MLKSLSWGCGLLGPIACSCVIQWTVDQLIPPNPTTLNKCSKRHWPRGWWWNGARRPRCIKVFCIGQYLDSDSLSMASHWGTYQITMDGWISGSNKHWEDLREFMNLYCAYYLFSSYTVTNVGKPKTRVVYTPGYTTFVIELICSYIKTLHNYLLPDYR